MGLLWAVLDRWECDAVCAECELHPSLCRGKINWMKIETFSVCNYVSS